MNTLPGLRSLQTLGGKHGGPEIRRKALAVAALAICAAGAEAAIGGGTLTASFSALMALAGAAVGYRLGRQDDATLKAAGALMRRVADDLIQYRAFTRLLRGQGQRITETTSIAATVIADGLTNMDAAVARMRALLDGAVGEDAGQLRAQLDAIGAPVVDMLGQLQFQDVTQQQIAFLSRLSVILDEHMVQLASHLGDRRPSERLERFRKMFDEALEDCVMDGQRDDHHAASGLAVRESTGQKLEMF